MLDEDARPPPTKCGCECTIAALILTTIASIATEAEVFKSALAGEAPRDSRTSSATCRRTQAKAIRLIASTMMAITPQATANGAQRKNKPLTASNAPLAKAGCAECGEQPMAHSEHHSAEMVRTFTWAPSSPHRQHWQHTRRGADILPCRSQKIL